MLLLAHSMFYRRIQNGIRSLALGVSVGSTLFAAGCAVDADTPELGTESAASTFDWGADCDGGSGDFQAYIPHNQYKTIGEIPPDKRNVEISLRADKDVDVVLTDKATGTKIIAWQGGLLDGPNKACADYEGVEYCYSGYNGYDSNNDGVREKGSEKIEINGVTNRTLVMQAFGYEADDSTVDYSWSAANTCNEKGNGQFSQAIPYYDTVVVGDIPVNKVNVFIELEAAQGRDVDIQLIDATDGTEIVAWPGGLLKGASEQSVEYQGMVITYSGYNGRNGNWGLEDIRIDGRVTRNLTMRAFGYQSGTANVTYAWGLGAGDACGSLALPPCGPGLMCKNGDDGNIAVDKPGQCHTEMWCESDASAADDCKNVIHIAVPGQWKCEQFTCKWETGFQQGAGEGEMCAGFAGIQCAPGLFCKGLDPDISDAAGTCQAENYCETATVDGDCANLLHPAIPGSWGCDQNSCAWIGSATVDKVSFADVKADPITYADGRIIQVTWEIDAAMGGLVNQVLGPAPTTPPPLGAGGDFIILDGIQCNGNDCDFDRGEYVTAIGRLGVLQGGHLLLNTLRAQDGLKCSLANQTCPADMTCQIGIGCPTPTNCGFNPPGMCLED